MRLSKELTRLDDCRPFPQSTNLRWAFLNWAMLVERRLEALEQFPSPVAEPVREESESNSSSATETAAGMKPISFISSRLLFPASQDGGPSQRVLADIVGWFNSQQIPGIRLEEAIGEIRMIKGSTPLAGSPSPSTVAPVQDRSGHAGDLGLKPEAQSMSRSAPGSESAEEQWDYQPHSGALLRYRNEDGSDFDEFKYLGYRDNPSRLAETAAYLNALESQVAALQSALDEHKRVNPELGYGYWTPDGKLSQGDGESTVMLYKVDELQSQIIQLEKRLDVAEKKAALADEVVDELKARERLSSVDALVYPRLTDYELSLIRRYDDALFHPSTAGEEPTR